MLERRMAATNRKSFRQEKRMSILGQPLEHFTDRKVECPCRKCAVQIEVASLFQHMRDKHADNTVFTPVDSERLSCRYAVNVGRVNGPHNSFAHCWSFDGRRFVARFQQLFPTWFAWVYVVDGYQAADEYCCQIEAVAAQSQSNIPLRTTYSGPLHAIDTPKKEIRNETPHCLQLTDQTVVMYSDKRGVTEEEKEAGFNAVVTLNFRIAKKYDDDNSGSRQVYNTDSGNSSSNSPNPAVKERKLSSSSDMTTSTGV